MSAGLTPAELHRLAWHLLSIQAERHEDWLWWEDVPQLDEDEHRALGKAMTDVARDCRWIATGGLTPMGEILRRAL